MTSRAIVFEPIASIALAGGPMKVIPGLVEGAGEVGVLGEEAVAGMDRVGAGLFCGTDDLLDREVALGRQGRTDQVGLVAFLDVGGVAVGLGVDGHRSDVHLLQGTGHTDCDLASIGDQNLLEHGVKSVGDPGRDARRGVRRAVITRARLHLRSPAVAPARPALMLRGP